MRGEDDLTYKLGDIIRANGNVRWCETEGSPAHVVNEFGQHYNTLMPLLFSVLKEEQSKEYRLLRAKAMECATLIGMSSCYF